MESRKGKKQEFSVKSMFPLLVFARSQEVLYSGKLGVLSFLQLSNKRIERIL